MICQIPYTINLNNRTNIQLQGSRLYSTKSRVGTKAITVSNTGPLDMRVRIFYGQLAAHLPRIKYFE